MLLRFSFILALTAGLCPAETPPAHIVQPLPKESDPREQAPFVAPADIVRPLNASEQAEQQEAASPIPSAPLNKDGAQVIGRHEQENKQTDAQIADFRQKHAPSESLAPTAPPEVPESSANAGDTTEIDCDEGVYFDAEQGLLVYMSNVKVRHPQYSLDCKGPLKIYLAQEDRAEKPTAPAGNKESAGKESAEPADSAQPQQETPDNKKSFKDPALPGGGNFQFNALKKIAASGDVVAHFTNDQGETYTATADQITYDAKTGEVILTGNYPTVSDANNTMRCRNKNDFIRVYGNGNIYFSNGATTQLRNLEKQNGALNKQKNHR